LFLKQTTGTATTRVTRTTATTAGNDKKVDCADTCWASP